MIRSFSCRRGTGAILAAVSRLFADSVDARGELDSVEAVCSPEPLHPDDIINPYPISSRRKQLVDITEGL